MCRLEISLILNRLVFLVFEIFFELLDLLSQAVHVVVSVGIEFRIISLLVPRVVVVLPRSSRCPRAAVGTACGVYDNTNYQCHNYNGHDCHNDDKLKTIIVLT